MKVHGKSLQNFVTEMNNMFKWFTKENLRMAIGLTFAGLMVLCLFLGRIDLSIFAVLFLILMEVEKMNGTK